LDEFYRIKAPVLANGTGSLNILNPLTVSPPVGQERLPSTIDVHVGTRVWLRRTLLGISQEKLAAALSLTFQQVQKYERGINRIGASRLFDSSRILDVPIGFFFDDMPSSVEGGSLINSRRTSADDEAQIGLEDDLLHKRETLELARAYHRISEPAVRKRVLDLVRSLAPAE
jgi:transcriptional regulator with XRE-family HTH domain